MIRVDRGQEPEIFNSEIFHRVNNRLIEFYSTSQKEDEFEGIKLNRPAERLLTQKISISLLERFSEKCAYCETPLKSDLVMVDRFRPRSGARGVNNHISEDHYWWLAYAWDNLLLSCKDCKTYKGTQFPILNQRASLKTDWDELQKEGALILDPCNDNPFEHLNFARDGLVTGVSEKGIVTIDTLKLNRTNLVHSRKSTIDHFFHSNSSSLNSINPNETEQLDRFLKEFLSQNPHLKHLGAIISLFPEFDAGNYFSIKETYPPPQKGWNSEAPKPIQLLNSHLKDELKEEKSGSVPSHIARGRNSSFSIGPTENPLSNAEKVIASGKPQKAFDLIRNYLKQSVPDEGFRQTHLRTINHLEGQFNTNENKRRRRTLLPAESELKRNQVMESLLEIIDDLRERSD